MNQDVTNFIQDSNKWSHELALLRTILLDCGLEETYKWKQPCYTYNNKNLFIVSSYKDSCFISFFNGELLSDTEGILVKVGENSQSVKLAKFTNLKQIQELVPTLKAYIFEAIALHKSEAKVDNKKNKELEFPAELTEFFKTNKKLEAAFLDLTPGRQRAYCLHFSGAKQAATRLSRIEKSTQRIMAGFGFNDCTCGLSKRKPNCDGSHKTIEGFVKM